MYEYKIKEVVQTVDGDTVDVILDLGFNMFKKERIRLNGIDAPESRTLDTEEKMFGLEAKEFLGRRMAECQNLWVATEKDGKYGRMLGDIWCGAICINEEMVKRGYAWKYDGGKKTKNFDTLRALRVKS
ncbi:MAG TPA: nuclease [Maribacter sp.]|nr:nuclease [Maribacter sp.]